MTPPSCGSLSRGFIFGRAYNWTGGHGWCRKFSATPAAFDFAKSKLERYYKNDNPSAGMPSVIDSVLLKDRIFVLQGEPTQTQTDAAASSSHCRRRVPHDFCITEYHLQNQTTKTWVRGKSYECPAFAQELLLEVEDLFAMHLRACDGFLMVIVHRGPTNPYFWLLDLSTSEWKNLPEQPPTVVGLHEPEAVLCRAFWNVIP